MYTPLKSVYMLQRYDPPAAAWPKGCQLRLSCGKGLKVLPAAGKSVTVCVLGVGGCTHVLLVPLQQKRTSSATQPAGSLLLDCLSLLTQADTAESL